MIDPALATIVALFVYCWMLYNVGKARVRFGVPAPATTGNADFERYYRVQMNTIEQMVLFLPSLWMFALLLQSLQAVALGLGLLWSVGRVLYALGYYQKADKRHLGFMISSIASVALLLGSCWGVIAHWI